MKREQLAAAVLVATLSSCLATVAVAAAHAAPTQKRDVSPVTTTGQPNPAYTVAHHYPGASCVSGSPTTGTSYECFSSQSPEGVFDSCWVEANRAFVACLTTPWTRQAVRLHVTGGYDNRGGFPTVSSPWGLRLGPNTRCRLRPGEVYTADGHAITYTCSDSVVLTGAVHRTPSVWTVQAYRRVRHKHAPTTYTSLGKRPITVSWRGKRSTRG